MDGQEGAAICLGEVRDSREEKGGWLVGWEGEGSSQEPRVAGEVGSKVPLLGQGREEAGSCLKPELPALAERIPRCSVGDAEGPWTLLIIQQWFWVLCPCLCLVHTVTLILSSCYCFVSARHRLFVYLLWSVTP